METRTVLRVEGILDFMKRRVVRFGTGTAVICPREFLGMTTFLLITEEQWEGEKAESARVKRELRKDGDDAE